jgi:phosphatidate phosphatase APP1
MTHVDSTPGDGLRAWLRNRFADRRPALIMPYRGFGTHDSARLLLRVLRDPGIPRPEADDSAWENLLAAYERFESDELAGVRVRAELAGAVAEGVTDDEGYFLFELRPQTLLAPGWHTVALTATEAGAAATEGAVLVPPAEGIGVISDIDDTVVEAGVTTPLRLAQMILLSNAYTRTPFPGVAAFYRALQAGPNEAGAAPIFYVSGSPWNLYDLLDQIFELRGVPYGPLMLRSLEREMVLPALRGSSSLHGHKHAQIERILETYPTLRFVLLGDSGQLDPEIYLEVLDRFPGRILTIYIRDVAGLKRDAAVLALAEQITARGAALCYAADTLVMAEDAAARGLIAPGAVDMIRAQ